MTVLSTVYAFEDIALIAGIFHSLCFYTSHIWLLITLTQMTRFKHHKAALISLNILSTTDEENTQVYDKSEMRG